MSNFSALDGNIYEAAQASVFEALGTMAAMKNVPLTPELREKMAEHVLDSMNYADIYELSGLDKSGLATMTRAVNVHLDAIAIVRLRGVIACVEGTEDLNDPVVSTITSEIVRKFEASVGSRPCALWSAPETLVLDHYAGKPRGPTLGVREDGTVVTRWWLGMFEFHRDPKEGPANIEVKGDRRLEEYYVEGKRHRPHEDGPAEVLTEEIDGMGTRRVEVYWREGKCHRPHEDGPAFTTTHYKDNFDLSGEEYFENGKEHRPAHLGAAVTNWDRSGRLVLQMFMEEGQLHRNPKEGPASFVIRDPLTVKGTADNVTIIKYCVHGETHRDEEDGPALVVRDNVTGVLLRECYDRDGRAYRKNGPAVIERLPDGTIVFEAWCVGSGWFYRDPKEGPAVTTYDLETGLTTEQFVADDKGPDDSHAYLHITRDRDGTVIEEKLWDGEQMHVKTASPAMAEAVHG